MLPGGIGQAAFRFLRKLRQRMSGYLTVRQDVQDLMSSNQEVIRNDSPMTLPPQTFCAHDSRACSNRGCEQIGQSALELDAVRVVRVRAE